MKKGASIIFVNSRNQIILQLRDNIDNIPYPGRWDLLGGNVEKNESPLQCIIREMKEELELDLDENDLRLFKKHNMIDRKEYTFWMKTDLDLENNPLHEGQCLKWFTKEDFHKIPEEKIAFSFKPIILKFFEKAPFEN